LPILETGRIALEHTGLTIPIVVRVISIEESVQETLLFGAPSLQLRLRTCLHSLPLAPFNASYDRGIRVFHGSPPWLKRRSLGYLPALNFQIVIQSFDTCRLCRQSA
jgi:hypothetical protein